MRYSESHVLKSWKKFVSNVDRLWSRIAPKYRHTDKFEDFWVEMIEYVSSDPVSVDVSNGYVEFEGGGNQKPTRGPKSKADEEKNAADLVVLEIDSYNKAVRTLEKQLNSNKSKKGAVFSLFGKAKTVAGSVQDIFTLSPVGKQAITIFKEGVELFQE